MDGAAAATAWGAAESRVVTTVVGRAVAVVHTALALLVGAYAGEPAGVVAAPAVGVGPQWPSAMGGLLTTVGPWAPSSPPSSAGL